jgi:tetrahydromethanopterin S-methyltransferase subunit D
MNYGFLLALAFAFAVAVLAILLPLAEFEVDVLLAVELTAPAAGLETGLATGLAAGAVLAGLLVALFVAASPQAIPRALKPRTVESAITFFILLMTPVFFSQRINDLFPGPGRSNTAVLLRTLSFSEQTII